MADLLTTLREVYQDLLALIWPTRCVACGSPDRDCCAACLAEMRSERGAAFEVDLPAGGVAIIAGSYSGPLRALLLSCKHAGRTGFASELGARLKAPLSLAMDLRSRTAPPLIVTAPSSAAKIRQRGYRHVDLIVRSALRDILGNEPLRGPPALLIPRALHGRPGRRSQVGLDSASRVRNAELVRVRPGARRILDRREVILVDDIVTTGATAAASCQALANANAKVIAVVALCGVVRRDSAE